MSKLFVAVLLISLAYGCRSAKGPDSPAAVTSQASRASIPAEGDKVAPVPIGISVICEETMIANPEAIKEMVALLKAILEDRLARSGCAPRLLSGENPTFSEPDGYILRVSLANYSRSGPRKILMARYDMTQKGQSVLQGRFQENTVKGSGLLVRVVATKTADEVIAFLKNR